MRQAEYLRPFRMNELIRLGNVFSSLCSQLSTELSTSYVLMRKVVFVVICSVVVVVVFEEAVVVVVVARFCSG